MEIQNHQVQVSCSSGESLRGGTSFFKTCLNGLNALSGVGILSMPYAVSQGGWTSLILLLIVATVCWYTGLLLQRCMDAHPLIKSYPDIGNVAFGYKGRVVVAIFMYLELYLIAVEFLILEGDNLEKLFPNMNFKIAGLRIRGKAGFVLLTALVILPTTWLKSLGVLAYISVGGVVASLILIVCVVCVGEVDEIGFHQKGELVNWKGLPSTVSLFAFCYCGHAVFPTLRNSMKDRTQFYKVLMVCFITSTITYGSMAIIGYKMFGEHVNSQVTLNLPTKKISTKIAIYTTLINPFTKYAVIITPIANAIEETLPLLYKGRPIVILIRTTIVLSTLLVALFIPFFAYVMAFIGAFLSVAGSWIFPCLCHLKMNKAAQKFGMELVIIIGILFTGSIIAVVGTYISIIQIIRDIKL
ncbi:vacuolar amino acid transporter 1 isoform X1 [Arachis ipaensis]|uniref:amino acid transporter AVT1I n=1 Tax=Arachis hypogaea TaxID=3818 RepID=UPI000A2B4360|nr:vacuolar amino acid transporter 1 isoform X1 [Arachis ipaensis]XP_020975396.1 vacuolar amino acid transporter 1 isoform X1 [Arachis ipaensis]XP_025639081.1 amino acid transporter AVT1I [Arachis hypogaea]